MKSVKLTPLCDLNTGEISRTSKEAIFGTDDAAFMSAKTDAVDGAAQHFESASLSGDHGPHAPGNIHFHIEQLAFCIPHWENRIEEGRIGAKIVDANITHDQIDAVEVKSAGKIVQQQ